MWLPNIVLKNSNSPQNMWVAIAPYTLIVKYAWIANVMQSISKLLLYFRCSSFSKLQNFYYAATKELMVYVRVVNWSMRSHLQPWSFCNYSCSPVAVREFSIYSRASLNCSSSTGCKVSFNGNFGHGLGSNLVQNLETKYAGSLDTKKSKLMIIWICFIKSHIITTNFWKNWIKLRL